MDSQTIHDRLSQYPEELQTEELETGDGLLTVLFFSHATLGFIWKNKVVYVDPLGEYLSVDKLPPADLIAITHEHYDHLDKEAVKGLLGEGTIVVGSMNVAREFPLAKTLHHGQRLDVGEGLSVEAVPAYNISQDQLQFHPRERNDNGYLLRFGDYTVYVAGDTEPIPEMSHLGRVDAAFLPVNQPYTMTPEQAAQAARTVGAPVFFPYHTTDTDMSQLLEVMKDDANISVRIHHMP